MVTLSIKRALIANHKRLLGLPFKGSGVKLAGEGKIRKLTGKTMMNLGKLFGVIATVGLPILGPEAGSAYVSAGVIYWVGKKLAGEGPGGKVSNRFQAVPIGFLPNAAKLKFKKRQTVLPVKDRKMLQGLTSKKLTAADYKRIEKFLRLHHVAANGRKKSGGGVVLAGEGLAGSGIFDGLVNIVKKVTKTVVKGVTSAGKAIVKVAKAAGRETSKFLAGKTAFKPSMLLTGISGVALLASMGIPVLAPILGPAATGFLGLSRVAAATGRGHGQEGAGLGKKLGLISLATLMTMAAGAAGAAAGHVGSGGRAPPKFSKHHKFPKKGKGKAKSKHPLLDQAQRQGAANLKRTGGIVCIMSPCGAERSHNTPFVTMSGRGLKIPRQPASGVPGVVKQGAGKRRSEHGALQRKKGLVLKEVSSAEIPMGKRKGLRLGKVRGEGFKECKALQKRGARILCVPDPVPGPFPPVPLPGSVVKKKRKGRGPGGVKVRGNRQEVWDGLALKTPGGLHKSDLVLKAGKLISKKRSVMAKKRFGK